MIGSHQVFSYRFNDQDLQKKFEAQMEVIENALMESLSLNPMIGLIEARAVVSGKWEPEVTAFANNMEFMLYYNKEQNQNNRYLFEIILELKKEILHLTKTNVASLMNQIKRFNDAFSKYEQTYSAVFYSEYGFEEGTLKGK